jgi:hypothetical protein
LIFVDERIVREFVFLKLSDILIPLFNEFVDDKLSFHEVIFAIILCLFFTLVVEIFSRRQKFRPS